MTTYSLAGAFGWAGGGKAGAIVDIWATSRFSGVPPQDEAPPSGNPDAGPVTTGPTYGSPGAYEITGIAVLQDYYVRIQYGGQTYWGTRTASSLGGVGGGGDVLTVFGRQGNVVATTGDYTAAQVGADASGSAATAQSNAETYAAAQAAAAQSNAETYASTQASAAEAAAKAASLPLAGGTMSGPIAMGSDKITGLTNGTASSDAAAFGQIPVPANGYGVTGNTGATPTPAVALNNSEGVLSSPYTLTTTPTGFLSTASLAVGTWLIWLNATCSTFASGEIVEIEAAIGTATGTLLGNNTGMTYAGDSNFGGVVSLAFRAVITVAGTVVFNASVEATTGAPVIASETITNSYPNCTGYLALRIA